MNYRDLFYYARSLRRQPIQLCGFTHTGLEQLSRRLRPDGNIGAGYTDDDILKLSDYATAALTMTASSPLKLVKRTDEANVVSDCYVSLFRHPTR